MATRQWVTPEEVAERKLKQKRMIVVLVPVLAIALGALVAVLGNQI